ncbi:MAG: hypothetical protein DRP78_04775 [Candidatus Omnitrophota bacterium]|nr:MAG: hypothetical protein DRP78_04775 [Candidatus Omnitrophota bacterium]
MSGFYSVFKNRKFFFLWLGQLISQFGDRLNQMALIALVYNRMGVSAIGLAKVMAFTIIPSFIMSPFAGVFVDRHNRKHIMIITDILRALMVVCIPLCFIKSSSMIPIYILIFFIFSVSCFSLPAKFSIIPELVSKQKLMIANSLVNTTMMVAALLGIGVGGLLIEKVGAKSGFYIDAFTYLVSAGLLCFVTVENSHLKNNVLGVKDKHIFREIKEGMEYVLAHPYVRFIFATIFMLMASAGAIYIVSIVFIQQVFGSITKDIGLLAGFSAIGFFFGALLCGRFGSKQSKLKIIFVSLIASGFFIGSFAVFLKLFASLLAARVIAVLIGISVAPIFISGNTLIHEVIKPEMRGRIFSSLGIVMNLGFLLFMFIASELSEFFNALWVIIGIAFCFIVYGFFSLLTFKESL